MKLLEYFKLACYEIWHNKLRTLLTLIGIIIGIAAIITIVSLVQGAEKFVITEVESFFPTDFLMIYNRWDPVTYRFLAQLTLEDIDYLEKILADQIQVIVPRYWDSSDIRSKETNLSSTLIATTESYQQIYNLTLEKGHFFRRADVDNLSQIIVLGADLAEELFGTEEALGKKIRLWESSFTVVGIIAKKQSVLPISTNNRVAYLPYTVWERFNGLENRFSLLVQPKEGVHISLLYQDLERVLNQRYGLDKSGRSKFMIHPFLTGMDEISTITIVLTILLSGVTGITLLVAGIGIMNIMLFIVAERKREIGLRKALGGTKFDILSQLIIESIMLCLVGGILGVLLGYLGSSLAFTLANTYVSGIHLEVPFWAVILAFGTTTCVGLFFGIYPAFKAAKLDPIKALHHE